MQQVAVAHFAERYGLFMIICLGESIVAIGVGAARARVGRARSSPASRSSMLVTVGLWWAYFARVADERRGAPAERTPSPVLAAADGYSYLHLLIVAGIIVFAVGARERRRRTSRRIRSATRRGSRCAAGSRSTCSAATAFRLRLAGPISAGRKLAAAPACLGWFAVSGSLPAWVDAGVLAAILAALLLYERGHEPAGHAAYKRSFAAKTRW